MSNVNPDGKPNWWTTSEDRILRQLYPTQGAEAAAAALPGRTMRAIYVRARAQGMTAPRKSRAGLPRVRWEDTPEMDAALRANLLECITVLDARHLADNLGRPLYWMRRRARQLGLPMPMHQRREWERDELRLLQELAHLPAGEIKRELRKAGYIRSAGGIALRLRRTGIDRSDPDTHTTGDLAQLMGVASSTVMTWVQSHGLAAKPRRTDAGGQGHRLQVRRHDLKKWLRKNPGRVDLRKVDAPWFLDLTLGAPSE
jgi:hypothetical protein